MKNASKSLDLVVALIMLLTGGMYPRHGGGARVSDDLVR